MLTLFTDTDTDFTLDDCAKYGYKLISMPYTINDKVCYPCVTSEPFDYKSYYDELKKGVVPTTSSISKDVYIDYFKPEIEKGNDIMYVHFSRNISGTFNNMDAAVKELKEEYKNFKFYEIDTKGISVLCYNIVKEVGELINSGKTADEVMEWAKTEVDHFALYYIADDLRYFKRSGRVSNLAGTVGTLIGIRPIIYLSQEGNMEVIAKDTGRMKAIDHVMDMIAENEDHIKDHLVLIGHADCDDIADIFVEKLKERFGQDLEIKKVLVNPTIGAHCGPNSLGVTFHSKHR